MIKRFSYSSLETYKKCPAQFRIRYIDKIDKPDEGIEAFMGKRIHESLEFLYNKAMEGKIPVLDTVLEQYRNVWEYSWHNRIAIVRKEYKPKDYFTLGERCIAAFYRTYHPFQDPVEGNEIEFDFQLDESDDYILKGILDRLDNYGDGRYEIHDYKSGKRAMNQYQADHDGQLALYQIALEKHRENVQDVTLVWHFLQHNLEVKSTRTSNQIESLIESIKKRIDTIRHHLKVGQEFPAKQSILCNWCYYWEECPAKDGTNPFI